MEFLLRKDGDIILWTGQAAAAAAVPTTAPNSFYAIPSLFATNLSLAWAEGLDWTVGLRQTPKWGGGNVVFLLKAVELLYVQLLKREIR
jgi:hypothetical protein